MNQQINQIKEQLGWQGMSGIVMLVIAGAFQILVLQPLEHETMFMHSRLDVTGAKANTSVRTFNMGDRQQELREFLDSLPVERDVTDILASIAVVAEASRVELKQAEYHFDNKNMPRVEYGLFFPVQGGYANIRHFVSRVLADHPAIALDQINFQRERINDPTLNAEIRFTIFLRPKY